MMTIAMITPFYHKNFKDENVEDKDRFVHSNQHNTMQEGES
jgi:transketolase